MTILDMCMDLGISVPRRVHERQTCPECSATRQKRNEKCLAVKQTPDGVSVFCHHCGWSADAHYHRSAA